MQLSTNNAIFNLEKKVNHLHFLFISHPKKNILEVEIRPKKNKQKLNPCILNKINECKINYQCIIFY